MTYNMKLNDIITKFWIRFIWFPRSVLLMILCSFPFPGAPRRAGRSGLLHYIIVWEECKFLDFDLTESRHFRLARRPTIVSATRKGRQMMILGALGEVVY